MAVWLDIDPSLVRIAWVLLAIFSGGIFVLVYVVMMIVVPLPPTGWMPRPRSAVPGQGWQPGSGGWTPPGGPPPGWGASASPTPDWGAPPTPPPPGFAAGAPGTTDTTGGWPPQDGSAAPAGSPAPPASSRRAGNAGIVAGVILIGLGVWFLVDQFIDVNWDLLWPVAIMVVGGALIAGALMRGRSS
jgi:phage shock protein PspC (stress-responsive transcriptional regulator)